MRFIVAVCVLCSFSAAGLEEVWRYDMGCGLPHLPVIMSYEGQPGRCLYLASRLSNTIDVIGDGGRQVATFTRPERIAGAMACNTALDQLLFQEGEQSFVLFNLQRSTSFVAGSDAESGAAGQLAFADLDGDDLAEVVRADGGGTLCVYDRKMAPQWKYDAGQPLAGHVAAGPVFAGCGGVYAVCLDGSVHSVAGNGEPLWHRDLVAAGLSASKHRRLLLAENPLGETILVFADSAGVVYALGAGSGETRWVQWSGGSDAGTPAVWEAGLLVLCTDGRVTGLTFAGEVVSRGQLPPAHYVPMPLVADLDGDGEKEMAAATMDRRVIVASLDGNVKETLSLPGNASQGLMLSDVDNDQLLELVTVTDCGRAICWKTRARGGWIHPAGNAAMNGCVNLRGSAHRMPELPEPKRTRRSVRVESVTLRDFVQDSQFGSAFVRARLTRRAATAGAVIRCNGKVVGATRKRVDRDGICVPFVQTSSEPLTLDLSLYNSENELVASSSDMPVLPGPVRLVDLAPVDDFLQALNERAASYSIPQNWSVPDEPVQPDGPVDLASLPGGTWCEAGGSSLYAPLRFAMLRGMSRQQGLQPWGVNISTEPAGVAAGAVRPGPEWERRIGVPNRLRAHLAVAAYLSGATYINGGITKTGDPAWRAAGGRGTPYTPVAFMVGSAAGLDTSAGLAGDLPGTRGELAMMAMLRQVYASNTREPYSGHLTSGPYGDIFDVTTISDDLASHGSYGVVWPLGDLDLQKAQAKQLMEYIENGGILVADAALAERLRHYMPGIQFTGKTGIATQVQTALDATAPVHAPYRYQVMAAGAKRVLAWTDTGHPLVVWRPVGKGLIIIGATDHWTDEANQLLPVAQTLLRTLTDAFLPIQMPEGFEVILNRVDDGWIVATFNNKPLLRLASAESVLHAEPSECVLRWKKGALLRFVPALGQFTWNNTTGGLTTMLAPGEAAIVRVTLQE